MLPRIDMYRELYSACILSIYYQSNSAKDPFTSPRIAGTLLTRWITLEVPKPMTMQGLWLHGVDYQG
jgi:hypothetical protein